MIRKLPLTSLELALEPLDEDIIITANMKE